MASGSSVLTLRCFYHTLRISVPTVVDAVRGRLTLDASDARLRDWAETLVAITRTQLRVEGQEHIPPEACIVMSNHQSHSDIPLLFAAIPKHVRMRMVAKAELFRVPIWGRAMHLAGFIPIDRADRTSAIASLEIAKRDLTAGTFIWIAPEGTRSRSGDLGHLKKGGFIMARDTGRPILPVCINGSGRVIPARELKTYREQPVHVTFRPLIQTQGRSLEEVMADVRAAIDPTAALAPASQPSLPAQRQADESRPD
ncbi:MAG: lysophospholipid acyltransferase family protein [Polyangia bacterium]